MSMSVGEAARRANQSRTYLEQLNFYEISMRDLIMRDDKDSTTTMHIVTVRHLHHFCCERCRKPISGLRNTSNWWTMNFHIIILLGLICAEASATCSLRPRTVVRPQTAAKLIRPSSSTLTQDRRIQQVPTSGQSGILSPVRPVRILG